MKKIPIGSIFVRTSGEYDEYGIYGIFKALKEIDEKVFEEWENDSSDFSISLTAWLEKNYFIEEIEYFEITSLDYKGCSGLEIR